MTTDDFIKKNREKLNELIKTNKPLLNAVRSVMAAQSNRIFLKAENKDGAPIGMYEGGEIWVSVENSPKDFPPKGKPKTGKNIENRKTGYFKNWLDYKKTIGRNKNVQSVDLILSGELQRNWSNGKVSAPMAKRINANSYLVAITEYNANKVDRYGIDKVFGLSKTEKELFLRVLQKETIEALKK